MSIIVKDNKSKISAKTMPETGSCFSFDEVFKEKQEYLDYTFDVYNKLYGLDTIKYKCEVPDGLFNSIKEKSVFILLVMYDEQGKIYLSRNIQDGLGWSLPGGAILNNEDVHSSLRRIARKICPNFDEVVIGEIEPIAFLENEFFNKNETHSHKGMAFMARIRNKESINLNNALGGFINLDEKELSGVNKYANQEVVGLAIKKIKNVNLFSYENEIATNEKYKLRYLVHNIFVKKFILTSRLKKTQEFISLLKQKVGCAKSLIDVSCGDSNLITKIIDGNFDYLVANDISWSQLDLITAKNNKIIFTNHNANQLPFKDKVFDVAYCGNTMHHMATKQDLVNLLEEIYRVARKILIVEIEKPKDTGFFPYILHRFWYRGFLKDVGGAYLSKSAFKNIIIQRFRERANIDFSEFKNIQGRYFIAEIKQKNNTDMKDFDGSMVLEAEAKFRCSNFDELRKLCKKYNFEQCKSVREIDDYFTDREKTFIKDRICLRFRDRDGQLEFTYKGKSSSDSHFFIKKEYNVPISSTEYKEKIAFLESLGFYKYVTVIKTRETYTKDEEFIIKNIVIDQVEGVGNFVEFEIIVKDKHKFSNEELKDILNKLIHKFRKIGLEKANLPYRDYVAQSKGIR
jgi:predicted adenylyl cyclase CyaB